MLWKPGVWEIPGDNLPNLLRWVRFPGSLGYYNRRGVSNKA